MAAARHRVGRKRLFVPVPVVLVELARRATGGRIAALERLASLFALPAMDTAADLATLGVALRALDEGLVRGRRRRLLLEARALLAYVLGQAPGMGLQARYVRAIEALRGGAAMDLPGVAGWAPRTIAALEDRLLRTDGARELQWRLDAATAIAEASPQGASRFLTVPSRFASVSALATAVVAELWWRACGGVVRLLRRT